MTADFSSTEFKMPGYTGYRPGVHETYKKTPVMAQLEVKEPTPDSFLYTTQLSPSAFPAAKDPIKSKPTPGNLWQMLQETAAQGSLKPPPNQLALGDHRIDVFRTSYNADFKAPFEDHEKLRSPNRNLDLAKTTTSLRDHYNSAYNRVGEERLQKIISTMRERLSAKMGNQNNNAFKFRRLFQMYDKQKTGMVQYEDFRNMAEQFGMQLDDDSLLALFRVYDPEGTGYLDYHDLAKHLMDPECYALYINDLDVSEAKVADDTVLAQLSTLQKAFAPSAGDLQGVLKAFDGQSTGILSKQDLLAGCAGLGLVLGDKELNALASYSVAGGEGDGAIMNEEGAVHYNNFIKLLTAGPSSLVKRSNGNTAHAMDGRSKPGKLSIPQPSTGMKSAMSPASPAPRRPAN